MRDAESRAIRGAAPVPDFAALMERVHNVIARSAPHDSVERYTKLGVDGGEPIGCELAQAFVRLGSSVTQVERVRPACLQASLAVNMVTYLLLHVVGMRFGPAQLSPGACSCQHPQQPQVRQSWQACLRGSSVCPPENR